MNNTNENKTFIVTIKENVYHVDYQLLNALLNIAENKYRSENKKCDICYSKKLYCGNEK